MKPPSALWSGVSSWLVCGIGLRPSRRAPPGEEATSRANRYNRPVSRRYTRVVAWWMLLGVFLAQVAVAAYACPQMGMAPIEFATDAAMAEDCSGSGSKLPAGPSALCLEHCTSGQQLLDSQPTLDPLHFAPLTLTWVAAIAGELPAGAAPAASHLARSTSPPPLVLSQRLRI